MDLRHQDKLPYQPLEYLWKLFKSQLFEAERNKNVSFGFS